jgi:prepilin-type N-terminal cleavage/methylation domain-containing protein
MKTLRSQQGFTLVELAIVLVIIGIILVSVLKGDELVNNSKVKRTSNLYRETMAAMYSYYDKYQRFPGDDNTVTSRWIDGMNGNNNGRIDGGVVFNCTPDEVFGAESCNAWRHLRLANIITGSDRTNPAHPFGGSVAIAYEIVNSVGTNWIAMSSIPGEVAEAIDRQFDDGKWNTGTYMASQDYVAGKLLTLYMKP